MYNKLHIRTIMQFIQAVFCLRVLIYQEVY